ncbi:RCC1 and BTB domain-containing protein 1-like [Cloeon dipterum]|uniref:RCC1 and BTB domain-containing protein 1-like n=1 Tax=Cloeon dipterum TaxID=197152 RepID=UPI00321FC6C4
MFSQIVCGADFTLALSNEGKIYSVKVNLNYYGHSGNRLSCVFKPSTFTLTEEMGRIREIAATLYKSHPCAAITEKNQVYIWGKCNGHYVSEPMLTSYSSFDEVYAVASPPVTYQRFRLKTMKDDCKRKGSVIERLNTAFNNPETADIAFIVEGKKIHVHKNLLTIGSEVFKNLFLGDWKDSCKNEHVVEDHSYNTFFAFLKYFYTDEVDFSPELALDVYAVAHFYLVTDLMYECERILKSSLTVQNAAAVYEKAILLGAKDLCELCSEFCKDNLVDVLNNFGTADLKRKVFLEVFTWVANQK